MPMLFMAAALCVLFAGASPFVFTLVGARIGRPS